jgi:hypothetical protein
MEDELDNSVARMKQSVLNWYTTTANLTPSIAKLLGVEPPPPTPPTPTIPYGPRVTKRARGGIISRPEIAQIGESGTEMVVPLENTSFVNRLANAIGQAVSNRMGNQAQAGGQINLSIDGQSIAHVITPYLQKENKRIGTNLITVR